MCKGKNGLWGGGGGAAVKHTAYPENPKWSRMIRVWNIRSVNDMDGQVDQMAKISNCLAKAAPLGSHLGKSLNLSVPPTPHL